MSVRVAFAQNRYEAEDAGPHPESEAVGRDQGLARGLGSPVEGRLHGKGRILRGGEYLGLAVDRSGRREGHPFHAALSHRLEHVPRRNRVLFQIPARMLDSETHVGVGRQVHDHIGARHGRSQGGKVQEIPAQQAKSLAVERLGQELHPSGREVVIANHLMTVGKQSIRKVAAHEPRTTCYNVLHQKSLPSSGPIAWDPRDGSVSTWFNPPTDSDNPSDSSTMNFGRRLASS